MYGVNFGAAYGLMMLAVLGLLASQHPSRNGVKNFLASVSTASRSSLFNDAFGFVPRAL